MRYSLIDELVSRNIDNAREMAGAQVIRIDNVDRYYHEIAKDSDGMSFLSFPNVAMPFQNMFLSCEEPHGIPLDGDGIQPRYGIWFYTTPIRQAMQDVHLEYYAHLETNRPQLEKRGVKTMTIAIHYLQPSRIEQPYGIGLNVFAIKEDGEILNLREGKEWALFKTGIEFEQWLERKANVQFDEADDWLRKTTLEMIAVGLFAVSLLHCKNVELVDGETTKQERRPTKLFERKKGTPAAKWKVLNIEPMRRVLREEGQIETNGLLNALHICRGHFKDYRHGKGLFGRHKDIYWWDQQLRGDEAAGVVIKDYNVKPPD